MHLYLSFSYPQEILYDAVCLRGDLSAGAERVDPVGLGAAAAETGQTRRMLRGRRRVGHVLVDAVPIPRYIGVKTQIAPQGV